MKGRMAASIGQLLIMAAIVAMLVYWPAGLLLAVALSFSDIPFDAVLTLGGRVHFLVGMAAWWLGFFAAALIYSATVFPWDE